MSAYDVVVIGAGPGGYIAAIRCAQLGLKTACIEAGINNNGHPVLGGTCLNIGCIPSKALLDSSQHFAHIKHQTQEHGISVSGLAINVEKMIARKDKIVQKLTQGIASLFRKNKVTWLKGQATLLSNTEIEINPIEESHDEKTTITAQYIIIATGSVPATIPSAIVDNNLIVDSTGALAFTDVPRTLGIIGAGAVGLELGSIWSRLGSRVVILEALTDFLVAADRQIAVEAEKVLIKQGLNIRLGARVTGTGCNNRQTIVNYEDAEGKHQIIVDRLIIAVGRSPNTENLGATECGLMLDERGFIVVDTECRTHFPNVYAIGDVVRGPMLAHKAAEEGIAVAERIAQLPAHINLALIPWVIYTHPEIAWVGKTEQELSAADIRYRIGTFPFAASGRARASGETAGLVKILSDTDTDRILGVHLFGPHVSELIAEAVLAMEFDGSSEDLARTIHAHPTLSEALHEAALAADNRALHI